MRNCHECLKHVAAWSTVLVVYSQPHFFAKYPAAEVSYLADMRTNHGSAVSQSSGVPQWLKDYMMGASQELYEVVAFPAALHGETFQTAASFIYDHCRAVLLAIEGTKGDDKHHLDVAALDQASTRHYGVAVSRSCPARVT